jgi:hypothetical protein
MACPYFMPLEKLEGGNWPHPSRLPLGGGWCGHCTAPGHEGEVPAQNVLETFCNLGYADGCPWSPLTRNWDAVRFAVSVPADGAQRDATKVAAPTTTVYVHFVCERNHRPVANGALEFDLVRSDWLQRHSDPRIQKMAECYLASYTKKKA